MESSDSSEKSVSGKNLNVSDILNEEDSEEDGYEEDEEYEEQK